ncbi:outer membrane protein assembly factor BamD [Archangium sp.]|uniref:tetratricopeptide repeat protein n=1 Tax=Archangium sp. TaxID=1872627 RepID=UPI00286C182F|nr:outer membrane protein assembly factor BamD [Archangium sp.]
MASAAETKPEQGSNSKELSEIRKEVIEARNLVIKTDSLLKNLHAEVKAIGKRHEDLQKRQFISSGVAYAIFAALCVAGAVMVSSAKTSTAGAERERLEKTVAELTSQLDKQRGEATASQNAQRAAADVFRLMTTLPGDERLKGVDELVKLDTTKLTALERQALTDKAAQLRREIGDAAFERGKAAFRRNDMKTTIEEMSRFVAMNPPAEQLMETSFFLGVAYNMEKKHDKAVPLLARYIESERKAKNRDYAMLLLAQSYQETNQYEKSVQTVNDGVTQHPASEFIPQFRGRLATVRRLMNGGEAAQAAAPAAQPAAPAPAPAAQPATAQPAPQ